MRQTGGRDTLVGWAFLGNSRVFSLNCVPRKQVTLENSHVIGEEQLLAAVVKKGPSGATLNSSYKNRDNMQSVDDLGNLILNVCRVVPANSGVLVFFPSYAALASGTDRWKQGSVWDSVNRIKQIFVEPRESGSFKMAVTAYTDEVACALVCSFSVFTRCLSLSLPVFDETLLLCSCVCH